MFKSRFIPILLAAILSISGCDIPQKNRQIVLTVNINDGKKVEQRPLIWLIGRYSINAISCSDLISYSVAPRRPNLFTILNDFKEPIGILEITESYIAVTLRDKLFIFKIKDDYVSS